MVGNVWEFTSTVFEDLNEAVIAQGHVLHAGVHRNQPVIVRELGERRRRGIGPYAAIDGSMRARASGTRPS